MKSTYRVLTYGAAIQTLGFLLLMATMVTAPANDVSDQSCRLDDVTTSHQLERCVKKGDRFVSRYLSHVRRGRRKFDRCAAFREFADCITPMTSSCPNIRAVVDADWKEVYDQFQCACNGSQGCIDVLECFEGQYGSVLARRCDAYYKFNVQQKTRDRCQFLEENISCKQTLIVSGCGQVLAAFAFQMSTLSSQKVIKGDGCKVNAVTDYKGFRYSAECPTGFVRHLEECHDTNIRAAKRLQFHPSHDLVVQGNKDDVTAACSTFSAYTSCVEPTRRACPAGVGLYLDHESRVRTYITKLDYICGDALHNYSSNIECYGDVLDNHNLTQCDDIFVGLQPILQRVTAYQFYCRPEEEGSSQLKSHLDRLRECYEGVFLRACNESGGTAMGGLIRRMFKDPFYLRYKYKPDCDLHYMPDDVTTAQPDRKGRDKLVGTDQPISAAGTTVDVTSWCLLWVVVGVVLNLNAARWR